MPRHRDRPGSIRIRDERGSASLMVLACASVLMMLAAALAFTSALVVSHRRAQSVADLAALAGAESQRLGTEPCASSAALAESSQAKLEACEVVGAEVLVTVVVGGPTWGAHTWRLVARARAGPDPDQP